MTLFLFCCGYSHALKRNCREPKRTFLDNTLENQDFWFARDFVEKGKGYLKLKILEQNWCSLAPSDSLSSKWAVLVDTSLLISLGSQENPDSESELLGPQNSSGGHGTKRI